MRLPSFMPIEFELTKRRTSLRVAVALLFPTMQINEEKSGVAQRWLVLLSDVHVTMEANQHETLGLAVTTPSFLSRILCLPLCRKNVEQDWVAFNVIPLPAIAAPQILSHASKAPSTRPISFLP